MLVAPALLVVLLGCGKPKKADRPLRPHEIHDFATLYKQNCAACHGADGQLGAGPPLDDALFLELASADAMREVVVNGRSGTLMPRFAIEQGGTLTDEQIDELVAGIRKDWGPTVDDKLPPTDELPKYDPSSAGATAAAGDVSRGQQVFDRACAMCHGADGRGGEKAGDIRATDFLALVSDQFLRRIVITGRPDLGMPDYRRLEGPAEALTPEDIDDVVALLVEWRTASLKVAADDRPTNQLTQLETPRDDLPTPLAGEGSGVRGQPRDRSPAQNESEETRHARID